MVPFRLGLLLRPRRDGQALDGIDRAAEAAAAELEVGEFGEVRHWLEGAVQIDVAAEDGYSRFVSPRTLSMAPLSLFHCMFKCTRLPASFPSHDGIGPTSWFVGGYMPSVRVCSPPSRLRLSSASAFSVRLRLPRSTPTIRPSAQLMTSVQLHGSARWDGSWHAAGLALVNQELLRTTDCQAEQSSWCR